MAKNLFIVFDGLDGSGKGEMIKRLQDYLVKKDKSLNILVTKEPTDSQFGKEAKDILKKEKDPKTGAEKCLELFTQDRQEHIVNIIEPFLKKDNSIVICDRYYYSTIAFQHTQGVDVEKIILENIEFKTPDIVFILDLPAKIAWERIQKRGLQTEKFENIKFMEKLRKNFLNLTKELDENIKIIDASKSEDEVFKEIKKEIDKLL